MIKRQKAAKINKNAPFGRIITAAVLLLNTIPALVCAGTYYVSADGNNANDGLLPASPWQKVGYACTQVSPGDTILLKRGDVFYNSVSSTVSQIEFDAYGPNELDIPVISGATKITNWQLYSGSIYVSDVSSNIGYLTVDGNHIDIARYPNRTAVEPWLRTTTWTENSDGTNTVITCDGLKSHSPNTDDYWNGANIRWHRHSWWFETRGILDYVASSGQLYLGDKSIIAVEPYDKNGWGFYLDNKLEELDAPGEYYYDQPNGKVYVWAPSGINPNDAVVEASTTTGGLTVSSCTVRNIGFRHQRSYGLQITGTTIVENCRFEFIGSDNGGAGLNATWGVKNAQVRNNLFQNNYNAAIGWNEDPAHGGSSVIEHNTLISNGTFDGYGGEGPWKAMAIVVSNATNLHIQYNHIDGAGYAAIIFGSNGNYAEYNVIDNAMATLNDGAAIYTNCSNSTIRYNIIRNTRGGMESSGPWANLAHGIWPEFLSEFHDNVLEYNTIINSGGFGIFLENNFDCIVRGNTIFGCDRAAFWLGEQTSDPQGHIIEDNILYSDYPNGRTLLFTKTADFGQMNNNYFCNPYTNYHLTPADATWIWYSPITIANWQASYPSWADPNAKTDLEKFASQKSPGQPGYSDIFVNDTEAPESIPLNGVWRDLEGNLEHTCIELEPFSSKILILTALPNADINRDCSLDLDDLKALTDSWLVHTGQGGYNQNADLLDDGVIDFKDFADFARQW